MKNLLTELPKNSTVMFYPLILQIPDHLMKFKILFLQQQMEKLKVY